MLARISHRFFRRHLGQLLLALIGTAAGIAVLTGVTLLRGALLDSLDAASAMLVGEQALSIRADSGNLSIERYAMLARMRGAPDWVPVLRIPARIDSQRFEIVAVDSLVGSNSLSPMLGSGLTLASAVEVDGPPALIMAKRTLEVLGLNPDSTVELQRQDQTYRLNIAAVIEAERSMDRRLLMDISQAQTLFGLRGQLSELLAPADAQSWLEQNLPADLTWQTAAERRASAASLTAGMRANLTAMSLLALATGLFVVYSVLNFLNVQRRHDFGLLRALGMTHARLSKLLICESLVLAALGGLMGMVVGTWLADRLLILVAQPVGDLYGQLPLIQSAPGWGLYSLIWCSGLSAAALVSVPLLLEAFRVPPGRLVRSIARPGFRLKRAFCIGLFPILAGVLLVAVRADLIAALAGLFLVLAGIVVMIPALGFGLLGSLTQSLPCTLPGRSLVLLQASRSRLAPALAALSLALALAMGMAMMILGFRVAVDDWVDRLLRADVYLSVDRSNSISETVIELNNDQIEILVAHSGVEAWSGIRQRRLADGRLIAAYDLPDPAWSGFDWIDGRPDRNAFEAGEQVFVTEPYARNQDVVVGQMLELSTPVGRKQFEIAAVFRDYSSDQGVIALNGAQYRRWFDDPVRDSIGLYLRQDLDVEHWLDQFAGTPVADAYRWITPLEIRQQSLVVFDRTFRISWALAVLVGLIALVALTSALLALGLERAQEYATLRALGLSPRGLMGLVMLQTTGVAALALLLAVPIALVMDIALSSVVQPRAFGWSVPLDWPPLAPILWTVPLALLAGLLTGVYPALRIARRPLIENLRAK